MILDLVRLDSARESVHILYTLTFAAYIVLRCSVVFCLAGLLCVVRRAMNQVRPVQRGPPLVSLFSIIVGHDLPCTHCVY